MTGDKFSSFLTLLFRNRLAGVGVVVLIAVVLIALAAPILPLPHPELDEG